MKKDSMEVLLPILEILYFKEFNIDFIYFQNVCNIKQNEQVLLR